MVLLISLFLAQLLRVFASYCGEDAIPFSLQALSSGQPVLGCARPSCFGWGEKSDARNMARFYRIHKKNDGFMRKNDLKKYDKVEIAAREPQLAHCEKSSASLVCDENTQWVGGISPSSNISSKPLFLQCCTFKNLKDSWDRGVADVAPGQIVVGGEVTQNGRQYAFDYIANIKKYFKENSGVAYSVTVRRFPCVPYLTKSSVPDVNGQNLHSSERSNGDPNLPSHSVVSIPSSTSNFTSSFVQPAAVPAAPLLPGLPILPLNSATPAAAFAANSYQQPMPSNVDFNQQSGATVNLPGQPISYAQQSPQQPFPLPLQQQQSTALQPPSQNLMQSQQQLMQPLQQSLLPSYQPLQPPQQFIQQLQPSQQFSQLPQPSQQFSQPSQPPQQLLQPPQPLQPPQTPLQPPQPMQQFLNPAQPLQQPPAPQQPYSAGQQMQPLQPEPSQFPTFPSLNQLGSFPLLPVLPSPPTLFG